MVIPKLSASGSFCLPLNPSVQQSQFYTERARKLETYIAEQKQKMKENAPAELRDLRTNIFVEAPLADIVEANMRDAVQTLETMALKVEKIRFSYESLMEGEG